MSVHRFWKGNTAMSVLIDDLEADSPNDIKLEEVRLHLSAAGGAGNFTITLGSNEGTEYDSVLSTTDMTALSEKDYLPTKAVLVRAKDHIVIAWPNAGAKIWGLEVIYSRDQG